MLSRVRLFATPWTVVHRILQARILEWIAFPFYWGSSQPRNQTRVSCIARGFFLLVEPPGKPQNTGVGSLSLLQRIFPTQESNQGLLHYRQILYQLSYQGSPMAFVKRQDATFKKFPIMSNGGVETTHRVVKIKYKWIWNYKKMKDKNLFMDLERCFELGSYRGNRTELWA